MRTAQAVTIHRKDYQPPVWQLDKVELEFDLHASRTRVVNRMHLSRLQPGALCLDGVDLELESLALNEQALPPSAYRFKDDQLVIDELPDQCVVTVITYTNPDANTALEGLYRSSGTFCTQCEAEGFRKISCFPDRPDVLTTYTVTIEADEADYPVLLSNGNLLSQESLGNGRHVARWHDPFPKPSYLFALVAGKLSHVHDRFVTQSGRTIDLYIYVEPHNLDKCDYAMGALKRSMRWDEEVFGLEYDLDRFMIVAVDDFNMGAMENKGLNVFNSKFVLASMDTATDDDFLGVEAVIAHEYFHNWTGNRVTCRDWFQLSLKEGLTVFRDQEFSSDMHSRAVKRIEDVRLLRARQFPEDASPMAHPIRPDSFIEINNFYTLTVYEKGAEVIRMLHTLLGADGFRRGMDLYFERHDGQAVTCDDFVAAMEDASGVDLQQFRRWYSVAGTPVISVQERFDAASGTFTLTVQQHCPDTPGQSDKPALHIPLRIGLLDGSGAALPVSMGRGDGDSRVIDLVEREQSFQFHNLEARPVVSILRGFSAPVRLQQAADVDTLAFLMSHDSDEFNRWEAGQRLAHHLVDAELSGTPADSTAYVQAMGEMLTDDALDDALKAEALELPSIDTLADAREQVDIHAICAARRRLQMALAATHHDTLRRLVTTHRDASLDLASGEAMRRRRLANTALRLMSAGPVEQWQPLADAQYWAANNMTDRVAALVALCKVPDGTRDACLADYLKRWRDDRLVVDKWFAMQAMADHDQVISDIHTLSEHDLFDAGNPNRLRSLVGVFANSNPARFHDATGVGYRLVADYVLTLDSRNPQIAARLVSSLARWARFTEPCRSAMRQELIRISDVESLSPDVYEIVSKSL